jgi:hypothetical protein
VTDTREQIISRLHAILTSAVSGVGAYRDRGQLTSEMRPAFVLLQGDETVKVGASARGRVVMPPSPVTMRPQIFYLVRPKPPGNDGVGEDLSAVRVAVVAAIVGDAALLALVGGERSNGRIAYLGAATDMKTGSSMRGELQLFFEIDYVFNPLS